jgi:malyl-CoA/(S)-citramalyl-CoA lyase
MNCHDAWGTAEDVAWVSPGEGGYRRRRPTLEAMRSPEDFFRPLAVGAPEPLREIPARPSRIIHSFPPSNPKLVGKVAQFAPTVDVRLANLENGVPAADKEAARAGLVEVGKIWSSPGTQFWTQVMSRTRA